MLSTSSNSTTSPQPAAESGGTTKTIINNNSTTTTLHNDYKSKVNEIKGKYTDDVNPLTPEKSLSPVELSPTLRSISPDSLMNPESLSRLSINGSSGNNSANGFYGAPKKPKNSSRAPIATGISTTIPVTGEKPKPEQKNDASLQDDVLYAIFLILYEKDPEGLGMTVKQICDTLVERHPDMANLSTKTSNLVSAKLNAYVKRVEKGDANLKYALSRDWADASPKRMVYVYRGLLTSDFHVHVKNAMEVQKHQQSQIQQQNQQNQQLGNYQQQSQVLNNSNNINNNSSNKQLDSKKNNGGFSGANFNLTSNPMMASSPNIKPRRQTMFDLGITKNTFMDTPIDKSNLFVPYSSAPVTASLSAQGNGSNNNNSSSGSGNNNNSSEMETADSPIDEESESHAIREGLLEHNEQSDMDFEDFEVFDDNDEDDDLMDIETFKTFNKSTKRSKSLSYLTMGKKSKILTAAAAAPRALKSPCSHSPNAAAAAAALHAAAIKAMLPFSATSNPLNSNNNSSTDLQSMRSSHNVSNLQNKKWLNVVRSGFLTQDIGTPEDISLSDLDKFFA